MKNFVADVIVIERRRIRVAYTGPDRLTKEEMHRMLARADFDDMTDDESLRFESVEKIVYLDQDAA